MWREVEKEAENVVAITKGCPTHQGMAIACCCVAITSLVPVALFQTRILKRLPDPPGRLFNSKRIVSSPGAYRFGIPDGLLGIGSYGVTLALLVAANPSRPLLQKALRGKLVLDAAMATRNARRQVTQFGRICSWCMGTAIATAGVVYFARKAREAERCSRT